MFQILMKVRDYECDLQGVVNNAVYQHYLEHARHEFLQKNNIDFPALAAAGIDLMVTRAEVDYKMPLRPNDAFKVTLRLEREGKVRVVFVQTIIRDDGKLVVSARVTGVTVKNGRPLRLIPALVALVELSEQ